MLSDSPSKCPSAFKYNEVLAASELPENVHIKLSIDCLEKALALYKIDNKELWVSFNGGKDSIVALHLFRAALYKSTLKPLAKDQSDLGVITAMYFEEDNSFEEMDSFIESMSNSCKLALTKMKKDYSLIQTLVEKENLKAIIMGTRNTDPHCGKLEYFSPSDFQKGFPVFMRVNPIIYWSYDQIWAFIRNFGFPYCSLYDEGYTYIGNKTNSFKNERLRSQEGKYLPAYLCEGIYERHSRKNFHAEGGKTASVGKLIVYDSSESKLELDGIDTAFSPFVAVDVAKGEAQLKFIEEIVKTRPELYFLTKKESDYAALIRNLCGFGEYEFPEKEVCGR